MFLTTKQQNKIITPKRKKKGTIIHTGMQWNESYSKNKKYNIIIKNILKNLTNLKWELNQYSHAFIRLKASKLTFRIKKIYIYTGCVPINKKKKILYTSAINTVTFFFFPLLLAKFYFRLWTWLKSHHP